MRIFAALLFIVLGFTVSASIGKTALFNVPTSPGPIEVTIALGTPTNVQQVLPGGVNKIRDENPCFGHLPPNAGWDCRGWLKNDAFVLEWDWQPSCRASDCYPASFSIIRVDGGRYQQVGGIAGGPNWTVGPVLKNMVSNVHGTCYVVVANNAKLHSAPSARLCLP
jgi:hypothetical protein